MKPHRFTPRSAAQLRSACSRIPQSLINKSFTVAPFWGRLMGREMPPAAREATAPLDSLSGGRAAPRTPA